jgi:hypothetical protein
MLNPTSVVVLPALGMVKEGERMENGGREAGGRGLGEKENVSGTGL